MLPNEEISSQKTWWSLRSQFFVVIWHNAQVVFNFNLFSCSVTFSIPSECEGLMSGIYLASATTITDVVHYENTDRIMKKTPSWLLYTILSILYTCWGMKTTDSRTREVLMTDKGKGNLCLLCQKPTESKNISVCEECIFDNNIFESLVIFKKLAQQFPNL